MHAPSPPPALSLAFPVARIENLVCLSFNSSISQLLVVKKNRNSSMVGTAPLLFKSYIDLFFHSMSSSEVFAIAQWPKKPDDIQSHSTIACGLKQWIFNHMTERIYRAYRVDDDCRVQLQCYLLLEHMVFDTVCNPSLITACSISFRSKRLQYIRE